MLMQSPFPETFKPSDKYCIVVQFGDGKKRTLRSDTLTGLVREIRTLRGIFKLSIYRLEVLPVEGKWRESSRAEWEYFLHVVQSGTVIVEQHERYRREGRLIGKWFRYSFQQHTHFYAPGYEHSLCGCTRNKSEKLLQMSAHLTARFQCKACEKRLEAIRRREAQAIKESASLSNGGASCKI
jgi:hypothetical protein